MARRQAAQASSFLDRRLSIDSRFAARFTLNIVAASERAVLGIWRSLKSLPLSRPLGRPTRKGENRRAGIDMVKKNPAAPLKRSPRIVVYTILAGEDADRFEAVRLRGRPPAAKGALAREMVRAALPSFEGGPEMMGPAR
jgi:hypothetical protein